MTGAVPLGFTHTTDDRIVVNVSLSLNTIAVLHETIYLIFVETITN